jgi:anti-sigma-K factor RskA
VKYNNENLRDALAAEYALGTLQGAARRRFEHSLKDDPRLRRLVLQWHGRLAPLDALAEPVQPPTRVWSAIEQRLRLGTAGARRRSEGFWTNLGFWRGAAMLGTALAVALAIALAVFQPAPTTGETMVVVLVGQDARPAMTVSWPPGQTETPKMRIRVIGHAEMGPGTSWELWMLPGGDQKPVSLGLIGTEPFQEVAIPPSLAPAIDTAAGLAMSVEPEGGSPTGLPTGPVIYSGQRISL